MRLDRAQFEGQYLDSFRVLTVAAAEVPNTIVITVKKVDKQGTDTVVTLEEKVSIDRTKEKDKPLLEEYAYESTIT